MPKKKNSSAIIYGQYLAQLRKEVGLSQRQLARLLGVPQSNITFWEHSDKPPRSDLLPKLADLLGVSIEQLLLPTKSLQKSHSVQRKGGPVGKARILFDRLALLPRHQQDKALEVMALFISQFEIANHAFHTIHPDSDKPDKPDNLSTHSHSS
jgi:transcriptional regulator with XRE-family HTH domain